MSYKTIFIIIICFFICSCSNEAQSSYEQIQTDYQNLNIESFDEANSLIEKIDNHLRNYPDFDKNSDLDDLKKSINNRIEQAIFEKISDKYEECFSHNFQNYDEATGILNNLLSGIESYIENAKSNDNISKAQTYISRIKESLRSINLERDEYNNVVYSNSVPEIESFLSKYPNSIMRGSLIDKIDEIYISEVSANLSSNAKTIPDVNNIINMAKEYQQKIRNPENKAQLSQIISNLDSQRRQILEAELHDKLQDLMVRMENEAKSRAEKERPTYKVEMCVPRGSNPEIVGYSSNFERVYQINMVGRFLGYDKRDLVVTVTGRISGDLESGVTISVTGSTINSDVKR